MSIQNNDDESSNVDYIDYESYLQCIPNESTIAREEWEQHQVKDYEEFAAQEQSSWRQDEIEQLNQIDTIAKIEEEEQEQRQNADQLQVQQWEQQDLEAYAFVEQESFIQDEMEQLHQIETAQTIHDDEQQHQGNEQLIDREQWEHIEFLVQQSKQPYKPYC